MGRETVIKSIHFEPDGIRLAPLIEKANFVEAHVLQLASEKPFNPEDLSRLAITVFERIVNPGDIDISFNGKINEVDRKEISSLNYRVLKNFATMALSDSGVSIMVSPALVSKTHPLHEIGETETSSVINSRPDQLSPGYYVRLDVNDDPGVLAQVAGVFGDEEINIKGFIQRASKKPGETAQMFFFLDHCPREKLDSAIETIKGLSKHFEIRAVYPIFR